jgi:hypothetical protein
MPASNRSNGVRIAMWSGPRSISTALLRAWGSRSDTFVCDEPLYGHYLLETGAPHPDRDEVIASQETDWRKVVERLVGEIPDGKAIFYQKQMAHHLLPQFNHDWVLGLDNAFLLRDPREMLVSLIKVTPDPGIRDTGLPQQCELFDLLRKRTGRIPPVIDSRDVLDAPKAILTRLCAALDVPFDEAMLSWEPGPRKTDGVWGRHWYASVEASTGFRRHVRRVEPIPEALMGVYQECARYYDRLYAHRLTA